MPLHVLVHYSIFICLLFVVLGFFAESIDTGLEFNLMIFLTMQRMNDCSRFSEILISCCGLVLSLKHGQSFVSISCPRGSLVNM